MMIQIEDGEDASALGLGSLGPGAWLALMDMKPILYSYW